MTKNDLVNCHQRITPYIHRTPILTSGAINALAGASLFFKCENFQKVGAFKMRGAMNAVFRLSEEQRGRGVVTHSSGNFAQALALAARNVGAKAYIVMPNTAALIKKEAVKGYDGEVIECEPTLEARQATADGIIEKYGATFLHPSNDLDVIAGQGTACMELLADVPDLEAVIVPVGGGGLLAGTCLAAHYFGDGVKVFAGEPFEADDAYRSLKSGRIESNETTNTIADGLRTQLGDKNFPIIREHVDSIIRVTEDEIVSAMRLIWQRMKIVVEPSSAVALAALLRQKVDFAGRRVGVILTGGNVDLGALPF